MFLSATCCYVLYNGHKYQTLCAAIVLLIYSSNSDVEQTFVHSYVHVIDVLCTKALLWCCIYMSYAAIVCNCYGTIFVLIYVETVNSRSWCRSSNKD